MKVVIARAFTNRGIGGNRAGIVFNESLDEKEMLEIAKQLNFSETVFVEENKSLFSLRYFTPTSEIDLCGHATIAALKVIKTKYERLPQFIFTKVGELRVFEQDSKYFMQQRSPKRYPFYPDNEIVTSLCLEDDQVISTPVILSTGIKDLLIEVKDRAALYSIKPNFKKIDELSKKYDVVGYHVFTRENDGVYCRNFAPRYGINEENATGTSNAALCCYLYDQYENNKQMRFLQGPNPDNLSEIICFLEVDDLKTIQVFVGGEVTIEEERIIT